MIEPGAQPLLHRVRDAAAAFSIGERSMYELIERGEIEVVRIGRSVRIPHQVLTEYVERLREEQAS